MGEYMHILFATTDFIENNGPTTGLPKYLYRTSLKLIEWGHKVTVVTCSNRTVQYEFFGISVYRVRCYNIKKSGNAYNDEISICIRNAKLIHDEIARIEAKEKIDIIQYTNLAGIAYYHDFHIPAIMRLSSYAKMWPLVSQEGVTKARTEMEVEAARKCNAIVGPSNIVAKEFSKDSGMNVKVIETPFVMESSTTDNSFYNMYLKGKKYLLFFGTIIEYKGLAVLDEVIREILSEYPNLHMVVIGDGNSKLIDNIKNSAGEMKDRFFYHPAIGFETLVPVIKNSLGVILPSLMENFSNACVESMALGKLVIGTDGVSFEQLISDGVNGLLCKPGDSNSLFEAIKRLMELSKLNRACMEKKAIERIERLCPENVTMQLLQYYEQIINDYSEGNI